VLGGLLAGCGASAPAKNAISSATTVSGTTPGPTSSAAAPPAVPSAPGPWDWPTFGHDAQHTFAGRTTLTESSVRTLRKAWLFPTGDSVTATPTVVGDTVYVGSWDDNFYAVNLETGQLRWKTQVSAQDGVWL